MVPPNSNADTVARPAVEGCRIADAARKQHEDNTKTQGSDNPWSRYLSDAKEEDDRIIKKWADETGSVLVFTGLFSTIVTAFLIESYKKLSPDSGEQTVALLTQLVNISTGVPVVVQNSPPFKPPASIVRVNVLWALSLTFSLSYALLAMLMQQWARRYLEYAQHPGAPHERVRIRAYMLHGVKIFNFSQSFNEIPLFLHASFFLFFAGLIEFLLPINKVVAFSALGFVANVAFSYATLTLLPIFTPNCPYFTPLSEILYGFSALSLFSAAQVVEGLFSGLLLKIRWWPLQSSRGPPKFLLSMWRVAIDLKDNARINVKWSFYGPLSRIRFSAMGAPPWLDASALRWILTTHDDDQKFEDFAARIPEFLDSRIPESFDSRAALCVPSVILSLLSDQPTSESILGSRLRELFNTCSPGTPLPTEEQRKNRLHVCLTSLWYCLRAYNQPKNLWRSLAPSIHGSFASPEVIHWIRTEQDLATRLLGRCLWSLIVKKLANDITLSHPTRFASITAELACLSYILGTTSEQVEDWLYQKGAIDLANIISLISGEMETLVADGTNGVPTDVVDVFQKTLDTLAEGIFSSYADIEWESDGLPADQVERFHEIYSMFANTQVPESIKTRLRRISDRLPQSSSDLRLVQVRIEGAPDGRVVDGGSSATRD